MWTEDHRRAADRRGLRYPSDLTDTEWELVKPFIRPAKRGGRPRSVDIREVLNAIFYVLSTGCQWNAIPSDLPPRSTVWDYLDLWEWDGTIARIHDALYVESRERSGRDASPTTAILDAQSAKGAVKGGRSLDPSGYDAGKKVLGRKRHVLVDTQGLLLNVDVHAADIQDRDGAETLLRQARRRFPFIERIVADGGYAGPKMSALVARTGDWTLQIVKRSDVRGFVVLPKRWIVERTLAWISRNRRLSRDYECHTRIAVAFVKLAMIRIMLRRIAVTHSA